MKIFATTVLALLLSSTPALAAENSNFDSDGVTLRYLSGGSGETVVLLHGFSGSAQGLYVDPGTFDALVDAGYRVVAMDQRGHGQSEKLYDAKSYGMNMVEDVRRLIDHLAVGKVHLVGYSMGARVANTFRSLYSDRLLTITLGGYGWPWEGQPVTLEEAKKQIVNRTVLPGNDLMALAAVSVGSYELVPSEESLRTNTVPAFAIIGDKDEVISSQNLQTFKETMANLELVVIPGTHAGPDGAPYKPRFAEELIRFLMKHDK
ncbi:MAG: alpha/beta hydrolase [Proteobacteria bacterium]|nr:alpha/beta hydrolase [Pseudomonadota bacterium]MDA0995097.1 alpha/beta hydrolase [Pseudomonadota bacterium]